MKELWTIYHKELPNLLRELCAAPPMERLRHVGMNCGCEYTAYPRFRRGRDYSRFDHSLGVGLIVWHFTGDPAQAAAGLLHDIATPVFAHVVDFLRGDYLTQEATEAGTRERIADSPELQRILASRGLTTDDVADYHRYPIADNDSPRLSADRLEYTLGNALNYGFLNPDQISALYGDLTVGMNEEGLPELQFRSREHCLSFARTALRCARVYVSAEDRYAMQRLSELLAAACQREIFTEADLDRTEPEIISRLTASPLCAAWNDFCALSAIRTAPRRAEDPDCPPDDRPWRIIPAKKRRIDPLLLGEGRASALEPAFAADLAAFLGERQTEWVLGE